MSRDELWELWWSVVAGILLGFALYQVGTFLGKLVDALSCM